MKDKIAVTSAIIKSNLQGVDDKQKMVTPIFKDHNNKIKELVGKEYAPRTLERYKTSLKHTVAFLEWKYQISDIDIAKINHAFITDYEFYLRSVRNFNNNTIVKYIKNFDEIIQLLITISKWGFWKLFFTYAVTGQEANILITLKTVTNCISVGM